MSEPEVAVPADSAVVCPAPERRVREHRKGKPAVAVKGHVAHGPSEVSECAEVVELKHQRAEARLVHLHVDVDRYLRKIHPRAPATKAPEQYRRTHVVTGFRVKPLPGLRRAA